MKYRSLFWRKYLRANPIRLLLPKLNYVNFFVKNTYEIKSFYIFEVHHKTYCLYNNITFYMKALIFPNKLGSLFYKPK